MPHERGRSALEAAGEDNGGKANPRVGARVEAVGAGRESAGALEERRGGGSIGAALATPGREGRARGNGTGALTKLQASGC